ncbi:Ankyrin Repeat Domain-Containing Protein 26 [Manis pentadactyla]|nr:Ankyrin Repeat Domain-Containing Protein 26 [Manis pentadactyla]
MAASKGKVARVQQILFMGKSDLNDTDKKNRLTWGAEPPSAKAPQDLGPGSLSRGLVPMPTL